MTPSPMMITLTRARRLTLPAPPLSLSASALPKWSPRGRVENQRGSAAPGEDGNGEVALCACEGTSFVCRRTPCAGTHDRREWRGSRSERWLLGQAEAFEVCRAESA